MAFLLHAPWTDAQIRSLNAYQESDYWHPFTCGRRNLDGQAHPLVATSQGWVCPACLDEGRQYTQDWCHAFMADDSWKTVPGFPKLADPTAK